MDTSKKRVTLSNDALVALEHRNMVSGTTATCKIANVASCPDTRNMTLYDCHANVFPEFLLEKLFLTYQGLFTINGHTKTHKYCQIQKNERDFELFKIAVDIFKFLPQNLRKNFW